MNTTSIKTALIADPSSSNVMNRATNALLRSNCDGMFIVDADVEARRQDVEDVLAHDLPLVAGWYAKKEFPAAVCMGADLEPGKPEFHPFVGLRQKEWVGRGFMYVHRSVFERLLEVEDVRRYDNCGEPMAELWQSGVFGDRFEHEDMNFCRRTQAAGFPTWVDTNVQVIHWGHWGYGLAIPTEIDPEPVLAAAAA